MHLPHREVHGWGMGELPVMSASICLLYFESAFCRDPAQLLFSKVSPLDYSKGREPEILSNNNVVWLTYYYFSYNYQNYGISVIMF